ncbi:hypothetical protein B10204_05390 [Campylobacter jejuni]|nr:hypothetical protein B10204_05390 [Campylobacter jejuni]
MITTTSEDIFGAGIKLENGSTIENIINTGTIQSNNLGMAVSWGNLEHLP